MSLKPYARSRPRKVSIRSRRLSAGEWLRPRWTAARSCVSIRSRRLSAGECGEHTGDPLTGVSIRSRRMSAGECRRFDDDGSSWHVGGRMSSAMLTLRPLVFQSAPADCRRENRVARTSVWTRGSVSIRSRRLSAGECSARAGCCRRPRFNPLPPTVGGRIRRHQITVPRKFGFNPLPPNVGGRMPPPLEPRSRRPFQSAPAECRRENAAADDRAAMRKRFQSAPAECRREN